MAAPRRSLLMLQLAITPFTVLVVATALLIHQQQAFDHHRQAEAVAHRELVEELKNLRSENDRLWESHRYLTRAIQQMNQDLRSLSSSRGEK